MFWTSNMQRTIRDDVLDHGQFRALFDDVHRPLTAHVLRRVGDRAEADDIVADVWLVAWRRRADVPSDPDRARMYLYGIARKVMSNAGRATRRRRALQARAFALASVPAGAPPTSSVLEALERLPERDRELLRLTTWDGLGHAEIAELMNLSVTAVANRVSRARRRLRGALTDIEEEESLRRVRET